MIDRQAQADQALVLLPLVSRMDSARAQARLEEACGLAEALDLVAVEARIEPVRKLYAGAYFGSGKLEALAARVSELGVGVVIVDTALSPISLRRRATDDPVR